MKRLFTTDWDAVGGAVAAVVAVALHLLHVLPEEGVLSVLLLLLAFGALRETRRDARFHEIESSLTAIQGEVGQVRSLMRLPDVYLIGPSRIRAATNEFARSLRGDVVYFNVCLEMFRGVELFDLMLRPLIESDRTSTVEFVLDREHRQLWEEQLVPKLATCASRDKVREPLWRDLHESISFILGDVTGDGQKEAQVSFWGEPFMAMPSQSQGRAVPRYILYAPSDSELIPRLIELHRTYHYSA